MRHVLSFPCNEGETNVIHRFLAPFWMAGIPRCLLVACEEVPFSLHTEARFIEVKNGGN
jgi:hypothetical protein